MIGILLFFGGMITGWFLFQLGITRAIELNIDGLRDRLYHQLHDFYTQNQKENDS